ncbi:MAG: endonuclease domain-containing protein [Rhodobacteraceae bacterium]|nr:endonuclease domain-containing protein [Paracoccaceae bacterium]
MTSIHPITRARAQKLRTELTPQERRLWAKLRDVNHMLGTHFRRQAPIGPFIADFADLGRRLVIEVDGGQHGGPRDAARNAWFTAQGFAVLRVWNTDVDGNLEGVMQVVLDRLDVSDAPPPHPSPTRGEGGAASAPSRIANKPGASPPPRGEGSGVGGTQPADAQKGPTP